jgi:hypothetical protein
MLAEFHPKYNSPLFARGAGENLEERWGEDPSAKEIFTIARFQGINSTRIQYTGVE